MAGATVLHGIEGFGASNAVHTTRLLSLSGDLPVTIIIVDTEDKPELHELLTDHLAMLDRVEVI